MLRRADGRTDERTRSHAHTQLPSLYYKTVGATIAELSSRELTVGRSAETVATGDPTTRESEAAIAV
jgi:hypothetical protein